MRKRLTVFGTAATMLAAAFIGCSDDRPMDHAGASGGTTNGTSSGGAASTASSAGAAISSDGSANTTDGTSAADIDAAATLCAKYGGPEAIMTVMRQNVLGEIAADCRVNGFFAPLAPDTLARIGECLGIMAQELFACPSVVYAGSTTSTGYHCHDMKTAHTGLGVSQGDFDALIEDVVAGLSSAGVEQSDIMMAAPALLGMQSDIVESSGATPSKAACEMPTTTDAGTTDGGGSADASCGAMPSTRAPTFGRSARSCTSS